MQSNAEVCRVWQAGLERRNEVSNTECVSLYTQTNAIKHQVCVPHNKSRKSGLCAGATSGNAPPGVLADMMKSACLHRL